MSEIRTWTNGAAWLAEFETGADAMDSLEGGWLDVQPELAEEGCAAVRAGVEPLAQELRTGELGRGLALGLEGFHLLLHALKSGHGGVGAEVAHGTLQLHLGLGRLGPGLEHVLFGLGLGDLGCE